MRDDQYQRLQSLHEKLLDVFLDEADPENWPGAGLTLAKMDAKTRGDLYWCRKTAASVLVLAQRTVQMIDTIQQRGAGGRMPGDADPEGEGDAAALSEAQQLDNEVARVEREAQRLMDSMRNGEAKKAFDAKTHGR